MTYISCLVTVPVASFRAPHAREYLETLPYPPFSTVYGMLCSAVGEEDRLVHLGAELAVAVLRAGERSRILRTAWQIKDAGHPPGVAVNKGPDFQEILTGVCAAVLVRRGQEQGSPCLADRVREALARPSRVTRSGGLALGESTSLIDEFRPLRPGDSVAGMIWLKKDKAGILPMPVWVDHVGAARTRYAQIIPTPGGPDPPDDAWITIQPPE